MIRIRILLAAVVAIAAPLAWAAPADELRQFYAGVKAMSAHFEQRLLDEDGEVLEFYAGRMVLARPGRFYWHYESPFPLELGCDGTTLWHHDVDLKQMTLRAAAGVLQGTPAALLGGTPADLEAYALSAVERDGQAWVRMQPRDPDSDFEWVEIALDAGVPQAMVLADKLGQRTAIGFSAVELSPALDDTPFAVPTLEGVTVVDER